VSSFGSSADGEAPAWRPRLELLLTALLFSTGGAAIKATELTFWQVASFRSGVAALTVFVLLPQARRRWRPRTLAVAAAYAVTLLLYVQANKLTTAASAIFLQSTAPLYILLLAPWLLGERVHRLDAIYMAVLAGGMALFFVGVEPPVKTAPDPLTGNVLAAISGLTWALTVIGLRFLGRGTSPGTSGSQVKASEGAAAVVVGNFLTFVIALPMALPLQQTATPVTAGDWAVIAWLGMFQIGVAYVFMTRALRDIGALEASLLLLVEPVVNPVWAWVVHGETPGLWSLSGGAVILAATAAKTWIDGQRGRRRLGRTGKPRIPGTDPG